MGDRPHLTGDGPRRVRVGSRLELLRVGSPVPILLGQAQMVWRRPNYHRRPVPPHAVQIVGVQVCVFPLQVHPTAGTRPPPLHFGHRSLLFMIAPIRVADHLVGFTR